MTTEKEDNNTKTQTSTKAKATTNAKTAQKRSTTATKAKTKRSAADNKTVDANSKLKELIVDIQNNKTEGVVTLDNGNTYTKVDYRIKKARSVFGFDIRIINNVLHRDDREVLVECNIYIRNDNKEWDLVQNAHAQESRAENHINNYNYVEVAETSAMGRALGGLGLFGNEFASINEMVNSISHVENKTETGSSTRRTTNKNKKASSKQLAEIQDFMNKNKDLSLEDVLDSTKAKKLEDLMELEAKNIIEYLNTISDEPL